MHLRKQLLQIAIYLVAAPSTSVNVSELDEVSRKCVDHIDLFRFMLQLDTPKKEPLSATDLIAHTLAYVAWNWHDMLEPSCKLAEDLLDGSNISCVEQASSFFSILANTEDELHEKRYIRLVFGEMTNDGSGGLFSILEKYHKIHKKFALKGLQLALPLVTSEGSGQKLADRLLLLWKGKGGIGNQFGYPSFLIKS